MDKIRHKVFWVDPEKPETTELFAKYLDEQWQPMMSMPIETKIMVVLFKQTDALDGLTLQVDPELIKLQKKND